MTASPGGQRFGGRTCLITGAGSGIGRATAELLARQGARVVVTDVDASSAERVARDITAGGGSALGCGLDVTDEDQWTLVVTQVTAGNRPLDVLINNAGLHDPGPLESVDHELFRRVVAVSLDGSYLGLRACASALAVSGRSSVVMVSSMFGAVGGFGTSPAYHSAKAALLGLTKNTAIAWAPRGVRVNCVLPGFVDTPILGELERRPMIRRTPLGRLGTPDEIAAVIAFLASDEASFVTGSGWGVDGGYTAQ